MNHNKLCQSCDTFLNNSSLPDLNYKPTVHEMCYYEGHIVYLFSLGIFELWIISRQTAVS